MKIFRFENIWLLSHRDKRARHVNFHPHRNLILGRNHTGKTSLIRSLFETLGAKPEGKLESWDENSVSLVEFTVDTKHYFALHQDGRRALFNMNNELIATTTNIADWSALFCRITEFNLVFSDKESEVKPAAPDCFFLPFYINQDGSWQSDWNTFRGMQRFRAPWGAILEYFTGVCPPEYYRAKAERDQETRQLDEQKREAKLLERTRERFGRTLTLSGPKVQPENFEHEIALLIHEVTDLNKQQEILRSSALSEQDLLSSLHQQIRLAEEALASYNRDSTYLRAEPDEPLVCPVCNAEHSKSFLDVLSYAEDARVLRDLVARLRTDADEVRRRYVVTTAALGALNENYLRISKVLDTRKGDLKFKDIVDSMGAESAFAAFEVERKELQAEIDKGLGIVDSLDERMKELRSKKRSKTILDAFRDYYATSRNSLALPSVNTAKIRLTSRPDLSGSGGPRSILAYYAALWRTCNSSLGAYSVPVVVDSPNQQGQDDINLPTILKFIANELPENMQLIVGLESSSDFVFDNEIILNKQYSLLIDEEWTAVESVVEPLLQKMHTAFLNS
ncbi:MAG: hypothetical protein VW684_03670 [Betaproteobacteria bacterium]|jgi:hypothetical protein